MSISESLSPGRTPSVYAAAFISPGLPRPPQSVMHDQYRMNTMPNAGQDCSCGRAKMRSEAARVKRSPKTKLMSRLQGKAKTLRSHHEREAVWVWSIVKPLKGAALSLPRILLADDDQSELYCSDRLSLGS
jgi:hypothetical protein